jgi:uncharacterized sulfatase
MKRLLLFIALLSIGLAATVAAAQPNILWITWEDCGPMLGCYGDTFARTPVLDAVATESVRYTQAFAYTGVCAPSRSCLITGVYPPRLGSQHMRSTTRLPEMVKCFPEYLRAAGYYCSNNAKEDYNFATPASVWDESSEKAHWRKRAPGQPFFSVFNFMTTHESRVFGEDAKREGATKKLAPGQRHADAEVPIPPIHPDTPEFRREWAWYYDNVSLMDAQVGEILQQLAADGLAEDTIVFFFADHGTGLPAIKMWAWDRSLRVPFLVRFPEKWQYLAPAKRGGTVDRLVSFVDFAPTVLSLCAVDAPAPLQGTAFLGQQADQPRQMVFGGKDRQGERYDTVRYAHDGRFHYLRNFQPHLPWGQFISYLDNHPSFRAWNTLNAAGQLQGTPARFFQTKPTEELYDVQSDPWETQNLAADPRFTAELQRLRAACESWMLESGDLGLLPERELHRRAAGRTPYELAIDPQANPLRELLAAAWLANTRDPAKLAQLLALTEHPDSAVRWWGVTGLVALKERAAPSLGRLQALAAEDESPDVRVAAAEALAHCGHDTEALNVLKAALRDESSFIRLAALNALDRMGTRARPVLPAIRTAKLKDPEHPDGAEYVGRMVDYLPQRLAPADGERNPSLK